MTTTTQSPRSIKKHEELTECLLALARSRRPGDAFPSQAELMRQYGVSDRTVLRSLKDLRDAGWIERFVGRGTFVADPIRPHPALPEGRQGIIAVIALSDERTLKYMADLISLQAEGRGLSLVAQLVRGSESFADAVPLEALHPQGFVVMGYILHPLAERLAERGHAVVILGAPPVGAVPRVPCVYGDHDWGGYEATRRLIDLGHRHLAYFKMQERIPVTTTLRWRGHLRALEEARGSGLDVSCALYTGATLAEWRTSQGATRAFFRASDAPTGLIAWNDVEAMTVIQNLQAAGLRVPEDVSVVGFDSLPEGEIFSPALTTVNQHFATQMTVVLDLLKNAPFETVHSTIVVPTLTVRDSCAPPPALSSVHPMKGHL